MAEAIMIVAMFVFFIVYVADDGVAKILSARKSKQLEIEKEITEQKRLDLEIAKANATSVPSSEA